MRAAVERLCAAIDNGERIRVWGDFDVDGQTSTSLLVLGLRAAGAVVDYNIPNRAEHSHGLNKQGIGLARDQGVRVLLTCDCGVTDYAEIAFAQEIGLDVIVSDHHDLGETLPDVVAVINPKRLPPEHPFAHLPGVGVAYLLIEALFEKKGRRGEGEELLDLVALGIVADVAHQVGETRYLLQRGLARLRAAPRPGIRALLKMANIAPSAVDAETIGFQIGPRLNAVGRLGDAAVSVELLTTEDEARATELAAKVEALNQERRVVQRRVEEEAFQQAAQNPALVHKPVIILTSATWHPSVLGVVASALTNRYDKPAILISVKPGEIGRASGRSVRNIDIHAAITAQGELIETSGGHPMAAGFAIRFENVAAFREGVNQYVAAHASTEAVVAAQPDAVLDWRDVTLRLADDLERLAPFGPGNPRPLLKCAGLKVARTETIGHDGKHQAVHLQDDAGNMQRALWWRSSGQWLPDRCDLLFTMQRETYKGRRRMQVQVVRIESAAEELTDTPRTDAPRSDAPITSDQYQIVDLRATLDPAVDMARLREEHSTATLQVWEETALNPIAGAGCTRVQLEARPVLVIVTAPPGPEELAEALKRVAPQTVVLLAGSPPADQDRVEVVLAAIAAMLKKSDTNGDSVDDPVVLNRMAARIGQRVETIRAGIVLQRHQDDAAGRMQAAARDHLEYLLKETAAYRRYFATAPARSVLAITPATL